jgi:elongation factor G
MEAMLEEKVTEEMIRRAIRAAPIALKLTPVMMGSAYKNRGVQLLLDGVLPTCPPDRGRNEAIDIAKNEESPFP